MMMMIIIIITIITIMTSTTIIELGVIIYCIVTIGTQVTLDSPLWLGAFVTENPVEDDDSAETQSPLG